MKENVSSNGSHKKGSRKSRSTSSSKTSSMSSERPKKKRNDKGERKKQRPERSARSNSHSRKSSPSIVVLGLDLSLTGTGLVVWDGEHILRRRRYKTEPNAPSDGLKPRPAGQLAPDRFRGDEEERIEWLRQRVARSVKKFDPVLVVIESRNFAAKGSAKKLDELQGVIKNYLHRKNVLFVLIAPPTLKLEATGNGRASKIEVIAAAKKFDRTIGTDDEADAMMLADLGFRKFRELVDV